MNRRESVSILHQNSKTVSGGQARWRHTWIHTWHSLHWRTTWPEYLVSISLLIALSIASHWIPISNPMHAIARINAPHPSPSPSAIGWILGLIIGGLIAIPWLTGRFYASVTRSLTSIGSAALPWSWPWTDPVRHRRYWTSGATWIAGFFLYWLSWVALILSAAVWTGRWGTAITAGAWVISLPWLIAWTGAVFIDGRCGWDLWRASFARTGWGFRWLAAWVTIGISIIALGGLAWILHPHTPMGIASMGLALLLIEYLLERIFNAWYFATYWTCFQPHNHPALITRKDDPPDVCTISHSVASPASRLESDPVAR